MSGDWIIGEVFKYSLISWDQLKIEKETWNFLVLLVIEAHNLIACSTFRAEQNTGQMFWPGERTKSLGPSITVLGNSRRVPEPSLAMRVTRVIELTVFGIYRGLGLMTRSVSSTPWTFYPSWSCQDLRGLSQCLEHDC